MPTYDYRCNACGHEFDLFQQMTAPVKRKCPKCGKPRLERLIGIGAGVLFKGGGFYETDYRSESYSKAAEAKPESAKPAESADTAKPDAASSAKPASGEAGTSKGSRSERSKKVIAARSSAKPRSARKPGKSRSKGR